jgi:hypothetical protein
MDNVSRFQTAYISSNIKTAVNYFYAGKRLLCHSDVPGGAKVASCKTRGKNQQLYGSE